MSIYNAIWKETMLWVWKTITYTFIYYYCNSRVCRNNFKLFDQKIITFIKPYSVKNNLEEECGSDKSEMTRTIVVMIGWITTSMMTIMKLISVILLS